MQRRSNAAGLAPRTARAVRSRWGAWRLLSWRALGVATVAFIFLFLSVASLPVSAQPVAKPGAQRPAPSRPQVRRPAGAERRWSLEVSAAALWLGSSRLGSTSATLTPNQTGSADRFTLFKTDATLGSVAGLDARLAFNLTPVFGVEGGLTFSKPIIRASISGDAENAAPSTFDAEELSQYFIDVSGVVHLTKFRFAGGRALPFVAGGGGYLRQLHEGNTLIETGRVYHAGGGVKYMLRSRRSGFLKRLGIRADARAYFRDGGVDFVKDQRRRFGAGGVGVLLGF